ncbi:AfsR/SARP family transcriptional regulator [Actinophytocola glycyrrhizae]|uniref:BTAD domain-containing putative transcriptional regulator n=1 Tax=Actinophytocola glycyrrhizae TaxID=2044873 RepID=A0ABV9S6Y4_9PSEU
MEFRILGPIEISQNGRTASIGGPKPTTLLALLAIRAGQGVLFDEIVDSIWGTNPPKQTRAAVHTYVSSLRRSIAVLHDEDVLLRSGGGYLLAVDPERVDVFRFERDTARGRAALAEGGPDDAATHFSDALALWRGVVLGGAQGWWAEAERARLNELRCTAIEDRADAHLATGRGAGVVTDLRTAVAEHPFRERLRGQLITALHQAGRRADAFAEYRQACVVLRDELGLEPGPALRAAFEQVARSGPEPPRVPESRQNGSRACPRQLPFQLADFTGRAEETALLTSTLLGTGGAGRLCAVFGKPGAGKSSLAVHVAHQVLEQFPDGQLHASLRGVQAAPADPGDVLATFLRALGMELSAIPAELEERAQLYRTLLADRRVLVVLDDAADERQVRPLLPGGGECAVLVTSRERLGALDSATQLGLALLDDIEAMRLLERVAGADRVGAEREQATEIIRLCGHLPLALRIAGARLAARSHWKLGRLVERLRAQRGILSELAVGDLEVRGSVALSYNGLGDRERAALRRLGLLDVAGGGGWLLAPLLDCSVDEGEELIERLADVQLLDVTADDGPLRFRVHDLIRAFAKERGEAEEPADEVRAALTRVAESLLALVDAAGRSVAPSDVPYLAPGIVAELLIDSDSWFEGEQAGLVRVVERVSDLGLTGVATRLASALCASRFSVRNLFSQWWRTHSAALAAAKDAGDRVGEARLLAGLGWLRYEQDRFDESVAYYEQAITAYASIEDRLNQARTRLALSTVLREQGLLLRAHEVLNLATADLSEPRDVARAAHELARVLTELGEFPAALTACTHAASAYREIGDSTGESMVLRSTGIVHRAAGRMESAERFSVHAVKMLQATDERLLLAYAKQSLAKVRIRQHLGDAVRDDLLACVAVCNDMQDGFGQALMLRTLGELDLVAGRLVEARHFLDHALQWWAALSLPVWRARTLRDLSMVLAGLGEHDTADATWAEAQDLFRHHGTREAREPSKALDAVAMPAAEVRTTP